MRGFPEAMALLDSKVTFKLQQDLQQDPKNRQFCRDHTSFSLPRYKLSPNILLALFETAWTLRLHLRS